MANTSWSGTDKTAGVTLSNLNLTTTASAASNGGRATDKQTTGKYYWEVTMTTGSIFYGTGCANASAALSTMYNTPNGAAIVFTSGQFWVNNVNTGIAIGGSGGGATLCFALDLSGNLLWARTTSGNWNGNVANNPATGVGGTSVSAISSGGLYPVACFGAAANCTANFGDTAFIGAVPAGFTAGFPTTGSGAAAAQARVMVMA
jgi:hypothetical protein